MSLLARMKEWCWGQGTNIISLSDDLFTFYLFHTPLYRTPFINMYIIAFPIEESESGAAGPSSIALEPRIGGMVMHFCEEK